MTLKRVLLPVIGLILAVLGVIVLENDRKGLQFTDLSVGPTPIMRITDGSQGPVVLLVHGPYGSRQTLLSYGQTLAHSGYTVYSFDMEGHGRHPNPLRADPRAWDETASVLVAQIRTIVSELRRGRQPAALLGYAASADLLVRAAQRSEEVGPLVLLSGVPKTVTATDPDEALLVTGEWQYALTQAARQALRQIEPAAHTGDLVETGDITRKAIKAPFAEYVAILHSPFAQKEVRAWFDRFYERFPSDKPVAHRGLGLLALLLGIVLLFRPVAQSLPQSAPRPFTLTRSGALIVAIVPALVTPFLTYPFSLDWVPVPAVDGLILHMAVYGLVQILLLIWLKGRLAQADLAAAALLGFWAVMVFGMALDRYGANFWPTGDRLSMIAVLAIGTVPFMIGHSWLMDGAMLWHRLLGRVTFLASLAVAFVLDPEGLFYLQVMLPVLLVFFVIFGVMARVTLRRSGAASAGLGLGLALAWAMGVSIPLIVA